MRNRDALSMAEATAALGVSVATARQMVARGQLVAFRTPGGHLRFTADSVRAAKGEPVSESGRQSLPNPLQNRRERVEELNLEAQEFRAVVQLGALRREQEEEEADRRAEEEALRQERKDQARALVLDRQRIKREEAEERERRRAAEEAQAQRQRFISSWLEVALALIPWGVPADVRLDVVSKVEDFLQECQLTKEPQIRRMVADIVADALAPWQRDQEIAAIIEDTRRMLPYAARGSPWSPTVWEVKAKQAAFVAIAVLADLRALIMSTVRLFRWRHGIAEGPPDPCHTLKACYSEDGKVWREVLLVRSIKIRFGMNYWSTLDDDICKQVVELATRASGGGRKMFLTSPYIEQAIALIDGAFACVSVSYGVVVG